MEKFVPGTQIPKPEVVLCGEDGNAFAIMGRVTKALRQVGVPKNIIDTYLVECRRGDYDHLLQTTMKYVDAM